MHVPPFLQVGSVSFPQNDLGPDEHCGPENPGKQSHLKCLEKKN